MNTGNEEAALRRTVRLVAPSPDLKTRVLTKAQAAWQNQPARGRVALAWLQPLLELAAAAIILLAGNRINIHLVGEQSELGCSVGQVIFQYSDDRDALALFTPLTARIQARAGTSMTARDPLEYKNVLRTRLREDAWLDK